MKYDVFISYSSKDREVAFKICNMLESTGLICWIAPRNVDGGKKYAREIIDAISESSVVLFILSRNSNISSHVESEIDIAFNNGKIIIPFRIDDTQISPELSYYINKRHYIDGMPNLESSFQQLKESVIRNIPRLQAEVAKEDAMSVLAKEMDVTVDKLNLTILQAEKILEYDSKIEIDQTGSRYDILQNDQGEIVIILSARKGGPENPRIVTDGHNNTVLLYRHKQSAVYLNGLNEQALSAIVNVDNIRVAEIYGDEVMREYYVPVRTVIDITKFLDDKNS